MTCNLAAIFADHPCESKCQSTLSDAPPPPRPFQAPIPTPPTQQPHMQPGTHFSHPPPPIKMVKPLFRPPTPHLFQARTPAQPTQQPCMQPRSHFFQLPPPIKISKHLFQPRPPPPLTTTNPNLGHRATSPATSQALLITIPTHQHFEEPFPNGKSLRFSNRCIAPNG